MEFMNLMILVRDEQAGEEVERDHEDHHGQPGQGAINTITDSNFFL